MKRKIKNNILKKIQSGEIKMRSRNEVLGEKFGIGGGVILLFIGLIFISGLVSYWFNLNSDLFFGGYGKYGLKIFTQTFPYIFIISFIVLFLILSLILRKFDFSYKKPYILLLLVIIGLVLVLGWFSFNTAFGRSIYQTEGRNLGMGKMMNNSNMVSGEVIYLNEDTIVLKIHDGKTVTVQTLQDTHYPFGIPSIGNIIRAVGVWNGQIFKAVGIRVFGDSTEQIFGGNRGGGMMNGQGKGPRWLR